MSQTYESYGFKSFKPYKCIIFSLDFSFQKAFEKYIVKTKYTKKDNNAARLFIQF